MLSVLLRAPTETTAVGDAVSSFRICIFRAARGVSREGEQSQNDDPFDVEPIADSEVVLAVVRNRSIAVSAFFDDLGDSPRDGCETPTTPCESDDHNMFREPRLVWNMRNQADFATKQSSPKRLVSG